MLAARLARFYGTDPMYWLQEAPLAMLEASVRALPIVQAEESLLWSDRLAIGTGAAREHARRSALQRWHKTAAGGTRAKPAAPAMIAGFGIELVGLPPQEAPDA